MRAPQLEQHLAGEDTLAPKYFAKYLKKPIFACWDNDQ
jgi:hypothetical protein